jgi:hypothetical protein
MKYTKLTIELNQEIKELQEDSQFWIGNVNQILNNLKQSTNRLE